MRSNLPTSAGPDPRTVPTRPSLVTARFVGTPPRAGRTRGGSPGARTLADVPRLTLLCLGVATLSVAVAASAAETKAPGSIEANGSTSTEGATAGAIDFNSDIRPILSDKCFTCHGPDRNQREGGLRLDDQQAALAGGDSGQPAIVAGSAETSELVRRILSDDPFERMPPPEEEKQLSDEERERLVRWVRQGAEWQELWSLVPPARPTPPEVQDREWPRGAIDRFVLARLERQGLRPSPPADPATLLRRITLDLTGLPPTPEETRAFLADPSDEAYRRVVDRLLASPRYGEHRARFWLDAVRYGDTHGLHLDNYREMWPYRDWVVSAFNRNLAFDRFVTEQIAGDLLPGATVDQLVATGFNRCNVSTNEGGSIAEEVRVRNVVDRTVTFGTVFLGLTLDCTRCHDHKYDPLTAEDFYSLSAFFNSIDGDPMDGNRKDHAPVIKVPADHQAEQLARLDREIAEIRGRLDGEWPELDEAQREWERQTLATRADQEAGEGSLRLGRWYHLGPFPDNRRYLVRRSHGPEGKPVDLKQTFRSGGETLAWTPRADWVDGRPHQDLPGDVAANFLYRRIDAPEAMKLEISLGSDDGIKVYLNRKKLLDKDVERGVEADQERVTLDLQSGENELVLKVMNYGGPSGFYFRVPERDVDLADEIWQALTVPPAERNETQAATVREHFRNEVAEDEEWVAARNALTDRRERRAAVDRQVPVSLIWRERSEPRPAHVLQRGEYDQVGHEVPRAVPSALPPLVVGPGQRNSGQRNSRQPNSGETIAGDGSDDGAADDGGSVDDGAIPNRLDLARWLTSPDHPLLARVTVNRWWQSLFGVGLVKTSEDFGSQGEMPSHPELLDWLSLRLIDDGWDGKRMIRRIVLSSTYRQTSRASDELRDRDPSNRLLARGPRFRLDAESVRDAALAGSGLLCEQFGGPSNKPPQPSGLWEAVGYTASNTANFVADEGHDRVHRRSLYTFVKRTAAPPQMTTLDAPNREACTVRRERTNTPLQALLLMNDVQFFEAARALAEATLRRLPEAPPEVRAAAMMRRVLGRPVTDDEAAALAREVVAEREHFADEPDRAEAMIAVGSLPPPQGLDPVDLAAWTWAGSLLFNLDEFLNKN